MDVIAPQQRQRRAIGLKALAAAFAVAACMPTSEAPAQPLPSGASLFADTPSGQWQLPHRLREISGLAMTADGRVFAHNDERAEIYEINPRDGTVGKAFSLGTPTLHGDFEDIAIAPNGDFYLTTSTGVLYQFREGTDGAHVTYQSFDTGLRQRCEIEGLAYLRADDTLILACKTNYEHRHTVAFYAWSLRDHRLNSTPWLTMPAASLGAAAGVRGFRTSALTIDPRTGRLIVLAARERIMAEIDRSGRIQALRRLTPDHVQAEGAVVLSDGSLLVSDEGRDSHALLTRYPRRT